MLEDVLVIERTGTRWGVERPLVRAYDRGGDGIRLTLDGGRLGADRVVGVATGVVGPPSRARPGPILARVEPRPGGARGSRRRGHRPEKPPAVLACEQEGAAHEG